MTASVALTLDTQPPAITITAPERVEPPDLLEVTVVATESIGIASVAVVDSLGKMTNLGYERAGDQTLLVRIPSLTLATGTATIRVSLADLVMNFAQGTVSVEVARPRAYDVVLTIANGHNIDMAVNEAFGVILEVRPAYLTSLEVH